VKSHPDMHGKTAKQAFAAVNGLMRGWAKAKKVKDKDGWQVWVGVGREDAEAEFLSCWDKVRYLAGHTPLENAVALAKSHSFRLKAESEGSRSEGYERFVRIAGWLQVGMGSRPIMLPVEDLAQVLGVEKMTVSRYRKWAKEDGYLTETSPHEFRGKGRRGKA